MYIAHIKGSHSEISQKTCAASGVNTQMSSVCNKSTETHQTSLQRITGWQNLRLETSFQKYRVQKNRRPYENDAVTQLMPIIQLSEIWINILLQMRSIDKEAER